jgi:hypothetical protein
MAGSYADRNRKSYNPAFAAGVEVDYRSGFGRSGCINSSNLTTVKIDRVTASGAYFYIVFPAVIPGNPPREIKFRTPQYVPSSNRLQYTHADEVTDSRYGATVYLRTAEHLANVAEGDAQKHETARRNAVASILSDANIIRYHMRVEDLAVLEALLVKYKKED